MPAVVDASFIVLYISVVITLLVKPDFIRELVSDSEATTAGVTVVVTVAVVTKEGVGDGPVVVLRVIILSKLLVVTTEFTVDVGSEVVLVTMVSSCTEADVVCFGDNSDDRLSKKSIKKKS